MRREDGQRTLHRLEDQHQDLGPRRLALDRWAGPALVRISERGLVPMMAVGKRDRRRAERLAHRSDGGVPGLVLADRGRPQPVPNAGVVDEIGDRAWSRRSRAATRQPFRTGPPRARRPGSCSPPSPAGAGSDPRAARPGSARGRECPDPAPNGSSTTRAKIPRRVATRSVPGHQVGLLVRVQRGPRVAPERPIGTPGGDRPRRAPVALVGRVARLVLGQVEPDDVAGFPREELRVRLRRDDVIRRRDDGREVADHLAGVAERAKRTDRGHGAESYDRPRHRPPGRGRRHPRNFWVMRGVVGSAAGAFRDARPPPTLASRRARAASACRPHRRPWLPGASSRRLPPLGIPGRRRARRRPAGACRRCGRRAHDGREDAAPGPRPRRRLGGDPGRPQERRAPDHGRAANGRRVPEQRPLRDVGRPPDGLPQGVRPARPATPVRAQPEGGAGPGRAGPRQLDRRLPDPRREPAHRRGPRRAAGGHRVADPSAHRTERHRADHRPAHRGRPAGAGRGLVGARPTRVAGRRQQPAHAAPARRPAALDRRRGPARDRGRECRHRDTLGVSRRSAPVPPDGDAGPRPRAARLAHRSAPRWRRDAAGDGRRPRPRARPGVVGRSDGCRRACPTAAAGSRCSASTRRPSGSATATASMGCGGASCRIGRATPASSWTTASWCRPSTSCRSSSSRRHPACW